IKHLTSPCSLPSFGTCTVNLRGSPSMPCFDRVCSGCCFPQSQGLDGSPRTRTKRRLQQCPTACCSAFVSWWTVWRQCWKCVDSWTLCFKVLLAPLESAGHLKDPGCWCSCC
ncbi:hypothetical protein XENOCAPTIV_003391, partial [Xenoophorus captivus]